MSFPFRLLILLCIILICITPISASKSKGLFSGEILNIQLDEFVGDVPDTPTFLTEREEEVLTNPQDLKSWIDIGKVQLKSENWGEAEATFQRALTLEPLNTDALEGYYIALSSLYKIETLLEHTENTVKNLPDWSSGLNFRGYALFELGRYEEALGWFEQAIREDPDFTVAWDNKGYTLNNLGRYEEALAAAETAVSLQPDEPEAWNNIAYSMNNLERYEEAVPAAEKAISLSPEYPSAWINLGFALDELDRYDEAITAYDTAIQYNPDSAAAWNNKGYTLKKLGRYEEALSAYDQTTSRHSAPKNSRIIFFNMRPYQSNNIS